MSTSTDKQLESIKKQIAQLKEREKRLKAKASERARKARTKNLIEIGALTNSIMDDFFLDPEKEADNRKVWMAYLTKIRIDNTGQKYTYADQIKRSLIRDYDDLLALANEWIEKNKASGSVDPETDPDEN